jgi:hypothetical protein
MSKSIQQETQIPADVAEIVRLALELDAAIGDRTGIIYQHPRVIEAMKGAQR